MNFSIVTRGIGQLGVVQNQVIENSCDLIRKDANKLFFIVQAHLSACYCQ